MPAPTGRPSPRRRERSDLFASILEVVKRYEGNGRITRISYGAGMPLDRLRPAVDRLVRLGLLRATVTDGIATYALTARGQEFLTTYWKMRSYVDLFGDGRARRE